MVATAARARRRAASPAARRGKWRAHEYDAAMGNVSGGSSDQRRSRDSMATTPVALKMVAAIGELNGISRNMMGDG